MLEIYEREKEDGLGDLILSSLSSLSYALDIKECPPETNESTLSHLTSVIAGNVALAGEQVQPDLYYMESILATLGWNLNDDIFLRMEVVQAKDTPVDKPFNKMHNQDEIIGHMTSSRLLDSDYKDSVDSLFNHIAVNSVIYKAWRDKDKKDEILQTIAEIQEGKWKVSMECLFSKFDYGVIAADGTQTIVERTPETSYLTKHLRAYGGTGTYQDKRIGRVLRNITFCGKGLVDKPGNPYSIIFNNNRFFDAKASQNHLEEKKMTEAEKAEFEKAKADLASAQAALAEFKVATAKETETKLNSAIAERDAKIAALQADVSGTVAKLAEANEKATANEIAKTELVVAHEKVVAELAKIKTDITLANRKTALAKVVAADRVEALIAKLGGLSDEAFEGVLSAFVPFFKKEGEPDADDKKKKDDAKAEKDVKEDKSCKADFAKANLDEVLNPVETATAAEKKQADDFNKMKAFLGESLTKTAKKGDK